MRRAGIFALARRIYLYSRLGACLFLLLILEKLLAESLASEVDALLERLALLLGDESVVGDGEGDFRDFVLSVVGLVEAKDDFCGDYTIEEKVELGDLLVSEILELLCCIEVQRLDSNFHSTVLLILVFRPRVGEFIDFGKVFEIAVGIDLRGSEARMPEKFLDGHKVGPVVEQHSREGVP